MCGLSKLPTRDSRVVTRWIEFDTDLPFTEVAMDAAVYARDAANRALFAELEPGDRVEVEHEVTVGFRSWRTKTAGVVVRTDRQRHGLHVQRNPDDKVFSDIIVLQRYDGELTTITLDEFSVLKKL
jgi:hypothetical protein